MTKKTGGRPVGSSPGLTLKQQRFVREYLVHGNATRAAKAAGYSDINAAKQGHTLLQKPEVQAALAVKVEKSLATMDITVERVLKERARLAFFDARKFYRPDGTLIPVHELDDDAAAAVAGIEVQEEATGSGEERVLVSRTRKVKLADKNASLTALEKHLGMYAVEKPAEATFNIQINLG